MLPKTFSWDRTEARAGKFNGKFLIGVLSTGIYCLPSCPARQPKPENVKLFKTEAEAQAAGLRACKRCRPDLFYRGEDGDLQLFDGLAKRVRATPENFHDAAALAKACGVSLTKLGELMRTHAHMAPAAWLRRERVHAAQAALLGGDTRVVDVGYAAGFESESVFHRQFLAFSRMTPGAYRALGGASVFLLQLPGAYRAAEVLAYHDRDRESPCERVEGRRIFKALIAPDGPAVLEISLEEQGAWCRVHPERKLSRESAAFFHNSALKMLGFAGDVAGFEARTKRAGQFAAFFGKRRGLRLPLTATGFDGLCWAIIGQQINIAFAASLRREMLHLAGEKIGAMRTHPTPDRVANIAPAALTARRYSRSKAAYLVGAAEAVASGALDAENMGQGSALAAERNLTAIRGIGVWTARYMMLRGVGFGDCAPVGDSALATALQHLHKREERPAHDEVGVLMQDFAPHRSLATAHLWASLKKEAA